jgi:hypothetical protein
VAYKEGASSRVVLGETLGEILGYALGNILDKYDASLRE